MLRKILDAELEKKGLSRTQLAAKVGVDKGTISRFFNGDNNTTLETVLNIIRFLSPKQEFELMSLFIEEVTSRENIEKSFEYASIHRLFGVTESLLKKWSGTSNRKLSECVDLYKLSYTFQKDRESIYKSIKSIQIKTELMDIFRYILIATDSFHSKDFKQVVELVSHIENKVERLEDSFIKRSYLVRVYELYAHTLMRIYDDVESTREYAKKVIELSDSIIYKANANITLGLSYMFEDYEQSLNHFLKARELQQSIGYNTENSDSSIYFIRNIWNKNEYKPTDEFASELAHFHINSGNIEEGLKILNTLKETPFTLYYRWKATGDVTNLYKSAKLLKLNWDKYYLNRLIRPALVRAGVEEVLIDVICL